ncbi:MAG: hypothetical protein LBQ60_20480 [Bacteroidales bacterium]|jgi:hypothetical protein|nr:hypothetical protein [Bacteroidales bacterium]
MNAPHNRDHELKELFSYLPIEHPSPDFTSRTMEQIVCAAEQAKNVQRRYIIFTYVLMICFGMIGCIIAGYFISTYLPVKEYLKGAGEFIHLLFQPFRYLADLFSESSNKRIIILGIGLLLLLLTDLFIRQQRNKKHIKSKI